MMETLSSMSKYDRDIEKKAETVSFSEAIQHKPISVERFPYVSVIVPVFNSAKTIKKLLESLMEQTYPHNRYEIIVVDNNSTDETEKIIRSYPVYFHSETSIQSSYAARNKGVRCAKGQVLAFIDADCIASKEWISEGMASLESAAVDLVGGKVDFMFSEKRTVSEIYDAITNLDAGSTITKIQAAGTVNLFVKDKVFHSIGFFPENVRSGGDMQFTNKAVKNGFNLIFSSKSRVYHPTRSFSELLEKSYRVGAGSIDVLFSRGVKMSSIVYTLLRDFFPPRPTYIKQLIEKRGTEDMHKELFKLLAVSYLNRFVRGLGMMKNCVEILLRDY